VNDIKDIKDKNKDILPTDVTADYNKTTDAVNNVTTKKFNRLTSPEPELKPDSKPEFKNNSYKNNDNKRKDNLDPFTKALYFGHTGTGTRMQAQVNHMDPNVPNMQNSNQTNKNDDSSNFNTNSSIGKGHGNASQFNE